MAGLTHLILSKEKALRLGKSSFSVLFDIKKELFNRLLGKTNRIFITFFSNVITLLLISIIVLPLNGLKKFVRRLIIGGFYSK